MNLLRSVPPLALTVVLRAGCVSTGGAAPAPGTGLHALNDGIAQGTVPQGVRHGAPGTYVLEPPDELSIEVRGERDDRGHWHGTFIPTRTGVHTIRVTRVGDDEPSESLPLRVE